MAKEMPRAITEVVIRRLAGDELYLRGRDYYTQGQVESILAEGERITAVVRGSQDYAVTLSTDEGFWSTRAIVRRVRPAHFASTALRQH